MGHDWVLWVLLAASALHVVEEHALGWQGWAANVMGRRMGVVITWMDFWPTNGALVLFGVSCAAVGWRAPAFALGLPALSLINAALFHVLPSLTARRPNPGLFTAVLLYVPLGIWCYIAAGQDHRLGALTIIGSVLVGAAAMVSALAILRLAKTFRYPDSASPAQPQHGRP